MSIYQALQLAQASAQGRSGFGDRRHRADQIIDGRHLIALLSQEQAAIRGRQAAQFTLGCSAHTSPFAFATVRSQIARFVAALW